MQGSVGKNGYGSRRNHYEGVGPGGYRCPCCAPAPKRRKSARRAERRRAKQAEKREK